MTPNRGPFHVLRWTVALIIVGCLAGAAVVVAASAALTPISDHATTLANRAVPNDQALSAATVASDSAQSAFMEALGTNNQADRNDAINRAQEGSRDEDAAFAQYLRYAGHSATERRLQTEYRAAGGQSRALGGVLIGSTPLDPSYAANLANEQTFSAQAQGYLNQIQTRFYEPAVTRGTQAIVSDVSSARLAILITAIVAFLVFLGVGAEMLRKVLRSSQVEAQEAQVRAVKTRQADLETRLQRALEMERTEDGTYDVIRQALRSVADGLPVELLVADSTRAHFQQVLSTVGDGVGACQVVAPGECPAASSGQTRLFDDSASLDTCPYLRDHPDRVWASCIPVSIAGRTTGVIHAEGPYEASPGEELTAELELVARKSGDRIGVQRVLARTEALAQVDPLTGLPNRRTMESRTRDLFEDDMEFVVAYLDLDHFKELNDLHGHDTGDRALRLFARVLRDSIRPADIPARYGGEEFVIILPECSIGDARVVAERLRTRLATALGVETIPDFTVSVGLAHADTAETLADVIDRADAALLRAKQLGRDRVVIAGGVLEPMTDAPPIEPVPPVRPAAPLSRLTQAQ